MNGNEYAEIAKAIGGPAAAIIFVLIILTKNGWWKIIIRDNSSDALSGIQQSLNEIEVGMKKLGDQVHELDKDFARMDERMKNIERGVSK